MRLLTVLLLLTSGCSAAPCVDVSTDCDPLYEPTFDNVHTLTLQPSCALSGCHSGDAPSAGLDLEEIETAYDALQSRVDAEDVGCALLIKYLDADAASGAMPPGDPLPEAERCAIRQWVEAGASR